MDIDNSDLDFIAKVSGWVWAGASAVIVALVWLFRKALSISKFILEVEAHKNRIAAIEENIKVMEGKVDGYRKESSEKLDLISRMIQEDSDCRARVAEQRSYLETERTRGEQQRHIDLLEAVNALRVLTKSNEERRKGTHALLETVKVDLRTTNNKFDQAISKYDKVVSFVDGPESRS